MAPGDTPDDPPLRASLAFGLPAADRFSLPGDADYAHTLRSFYPDAEAVALEQVYRLKKLCRNASGQQFWRVISEGLARIYGAQIAVIAKRLYVDPKTGDALPAIGNVGACLSAVAWYCDGMPNGEPFASDFQYSAWQCACAGMKHEKVFVVPSGLDDFAPANPNAPVLPFPLEAYISVPLFRPDGVCFGHFGMVWSPDGAAKRVLSWPFMEAIMYAFEDMILDHLAETNVVPHNSPHITFQQSSEETTSHQDLHAHVGVLSHELRTPMQGVVGMLDLMHSKVEEAISTKKGSSYQTVFSDLIDDIELMRDSSRRAVEAADNVVQAYDIDSRPDADRRHSDSSQPGSANEVHRQEASSASAQFFNSSSRGAKRRISEAGLLSERDAKVRVSERMIHSATHDREAQLRRAVADGKELLTSTNALGDIGHDATLEALRPHAEIPPAPTPRRIEGLHYCKIKDLVRYVVGQSVHVETTITGTNDPILKGKTSVKAQYRQNNGINQTKIINWGVDPQVPETILIHEKDLTKLISCVFQNSLKFTEQGLITIDVAFDFSTQSISMDVVDNGPGIPKQFHSKLFRAFSREDSSISRRTEGLGLGLLVAKGIARKLGGDLTLVRADTEGPHHGSHFSIRIPIMPPELTGHAFAVSHGPSVAHTPSETPAAPSTPVYQPPIFAQPSPPMSPKPLDVSSPPQPATKGLEDGSDGASIHARTAGEKLAKTHPLTFMVAEDNIVNRRLLVNMLTKMGYDRTTQIYEAQDGVDAVRQATEIHEQYISGLAMNGHSSKKPIDLILMDLWMPMMDGYEATERILGMYTRTRSGNMRRAISEPGKIPCPMDGQHAEHKTEAAASDDVAQGPLLLPPTIMAVSADATEAAAQRAEKVGMQGYLAKPFKIKDLEDMVKQGWAKRMNMISAMA